MNTATATPITAAPLFVAREALKQGIYGEAFTQMTQQAENDHFMPAGLDQPQQAEYLYNLLRYKAATAIKMARLAINEAEDQVSHLPRSLAPDFSAIRADLDAKEAAEKQYPTVTLPERFNAVIPQYQTPSRSACTIKVSSHQYPSLAGAIVGILTNERLIVSTTDSEILFATPYKSSDYSNQVIAEINDLIEAQGLIMADLLGVRKLA